MCPGDTVRTHRVLACSHVSAEGAAGAKARVDVQRARRPFGPLPPLRAPQAVPPLHRNTLCVENKK